MTNVFVLKMLFTFVYDCKDENHWSLLIIHYSEYKHPKFKNLKYNFLYFDQAKYLLQDIAVKACLCVG